MPGHIGMHRHICKFRDSLQTRMHGHHPHEHWDSVPSLFFRTDQETEVSSVGRTLTEHLLYAMGYTWQYWSVLKKKRQNLCSQLREVDSFMSKQMSQCAKGQAGVGSMFQDPCPTECWAQVFSSSAHTYIYRYEPILVSFICRLDTA